MKKFGISLLLIVNCTLFGFTNSVNDNDTDVLRWEILVNVEWVWEDDFYNAKFNDQQRELDGQELIVEGFMFPLEYTRKHQNFLVSSSPMSQCFFCGPGEAESMVYVRTTEPVDYTNRKMKVKGTFKLVSDASMGIIYELEDAEIVR